MRRQRREHRTIALAGRQVPYSVVTSRTARKTRIRVGPGGVEVILASTAPLERAANFLVERADWVLRQLDRIESMGELRRVRRRGEPGTVLLGGERVPLDVITTKSHREFTTVERNGGRLSVRVPGGGTGDVGKAVERWMRREARRVVETRVGVWAKLVKRMPNRVFIRGQLTKWGNCSRLGNLSFNWRLVMAPLGSLDAIVIHELVHLVEPTHNARFWLFVRSLCPTYADQVRWLAEQRSQMFLPLFDV